MKKLFLIAIAAIAFSTSMQAQDSTGRHKQMKRGDHPAARMQRSEAFEELNLTADQKEKMRQMREENMAKMNDIKNNSALNDTQKQEQMKALRQDQRKMMESLLTGEQKEKMKQLRSERMKGMRDKRHDADSSQPE